MWKTGLCLITIFVTSSLGNFILITDGILGKIYKLNITSKSIDEVAVSRSHTPVAIDYDILEKRIFWTDVGLSEIRSITIDGNNERLIRWLGNGSVPDGLAVDPISRLIFYTDAFYHQIASLHYDGSSYTVLIDSDIDTPRDIVLDTTDRIMYWSDWGSQPKIETANYDGSNRKTIVSNDITWPNGIAIDTEAGNIYWADGGTHRIEVCKIDGSHRQVLFYELISHFFGLTLYQRTLFFTDWTERGIRTLPTSGGQPSHYGPQIFIRLYDIYIYKNTFPDIPVIVNISHKPADITECTEKVTLTCQVSSKDVSTITWYRGNQLLPTAEDAHNKGVYIITNVSRTISGQYACVARNQNGYVNKTINVTVKYTPDVLVTTINVTTEDPYVDIICNATGVPDRYTFSPWTHQWDINGPVLYHPGLGNSRVLRLTNLTYDYSGGYTCKTNNGIDCSKNQHAGSGYIILVIKAPPILINPLSNANGKRISLASSMDRSVMFSFTFWTNIEDTTVICYQRHNDVRSDSPVGEVTLTAVSVELPVISSTVTTVGTQASLLIDINNVNDFGHYDVLISNQMGEELLAISVEESKGDSSHTDVGLVAGLTSGAVAALLLVVGLVYYTTRRYGCTVNRTSGLDSDTTAGRSNNGEDLDISSNPDPVYADLDYSTDNINRNAPDQFNLYERANYPGKPEHLYADLQQVSKEGPETIYINLQ